MKSRLSLALFFCVFCTCLLGTFALISHQFLDLSLTKTLDDQLTQLSDYLKSEVEAANTKPVLNIDEEDRTAVLRDATVQLFFEKHEVFNSGSVAPKRLYPGFSDQEVLGRKVRVYAAPVSAKTWLQLTLPSDERTRALAAYHTMLKYFLPLAITFVCISAYAFSGFALRPIERRFEDLQRFVADVGHELRTPITIALSNIQAAQLISQQDGRHGERLEAAERAALRMKVLVEDLVLLSKSGERLSTKPLRDADLRALAERCVREVEPGYATKGVSISFGGQTSPVHCDVDAISRAIANLLENALAYTDAGGHVAVRVTHDQRHACCTVADTGIGIPATLLEKVFDRFFRVDESRDRHSGGAGLGLSIVKGIVEQHGGRVWVESDVGRGSKFHLQIPLLH